MIITTERLRLRDLRPDDLSAYRTMHSDAEFERFCARGDGADGHAEDLFNTFIAWSAADPRLNYQLAIELATGGLIGSCGIRITSPERREASFGCELSRSEWGRGYAVEASRALISYGFGELGLDSIFAETDPANIAALSLANKLGFKPGADGPQILHKSDWPTAA